MLASNKVYRLKSWASQSAAFSCVDYALLLSRFCALVIAYMVASGLTILQCLLTKPVGQTWQTGQEIKD